MTRKCLSCNQEFVMKTVTQKYCGPACKAHAAYMRRTGKVEPDVPARDFVCAYCGKRVVIPAGNIRDKRTRFCCGACEKAFWRHGKAKKGVIISKPD